MKFEIESHSAELISGWMMLLLLKFSYRALLPRYLGKVLLVSWVYIEQGPPFWDVSGSSVGFFRVVAHCNKCRLPLYIYKVYHHEVLGVASPRN